MLRLGIDTGGTYTDAVLLAEDSTVLASAKALTTHDDLIVGIRAALAALFEPTPGPVTLVCLSTTLATNAIVEHRGASAGLVMIGSDPALLGRGGLSAALAGDPALHLDGGHDASGAERAALDLAPLAPWLEQAAETVTAFAVCAEFGAINPSHETAVRDVIRSTTGMPVTCAHELSTQLNAPRRALTALLNARLLDRITALMDAVERALAELELNARLMVVKGDGSLIDVELARERPVETILSGPAASVVGTAHLAKRDRVIVADIGGTTTDIAILDDGRPRLAPTGAKVGGFHTMVGAAAVHSVGLGGDSEVSPTAHGELRTGPRRIVPVCRAAREHPHIVERLSALSDVRSIDDLRFVWRDPLRTGRAPRLRRDEVALWEQLGDAPIPAAAVAPDRYRGGILQRLIERGLVASCGLTPTDAAHVLELESTGSRDAAELVHRGWLVLLRDRADTRAQNCVEDPRELAEQVLDALARANARALVVAAYEAESPTRVDAATWHAAQPLLKHALDQRARSHESALLALEPRLLAPVAAVGASAVTHFPRVARHLELTLDIPPHAAVSNAIGAVVGSVLQQVEIRVTSPAPGLYRVHGENACDHGDLASALEDASQRAGERVRALAARAGAPDATVGTRTLERSARIGADEKIFVEATVVATAQGRPAQTR